MLYKNAEFNFFLNISFSEITNLKLYHLYHRNTRPTLLDIFIIE